MKSIRMRALSILVLTTAFSCNSYAVDIEPSAASNLSSYDFGEFIKKYMPDKDSPDNWNYNTNSKNIVWDGGVSWNDELKAYEKSGYTGVNFDDNKMLTLMNKNHGKAGPEVIWNTTYYGKTNNDVERIRISHDNVAGMTHPSKHESLHPFESFLKEGVVPRTLCLNMVGKNGYSIVYKLSSSGKKDIYLTNNSDGVSCFYDIVLDREVAVDTFMKSNDLNPIYGHCTTKY